METLTGTFRTDVAILADILGVGRNYDISERTLLIGGRDAHLYFLDGYGKDAVIERILSVFLALTPEQRSFVLSFLRNRGNIREMEKELGISYPTVRARLDQILAALGLEANPGKEKPARKEVLEMLAQGEITQEQALDMLKKP